MIRFGVVGTNWITDRFLEAALLHEDFELAAVYSRTGEKAKAFAEKYGVNATFTDLSEMAKSDVFDAVYIASPNSFHAEQSMVFMNAGKHVLCEKPMVSNVREVEKMIDAAKRNNVLLMEAMMTTFQPNFLAIKDNLHKIGKVRRYVANYCQYSSRYDAYKKGTVLNAFNPAFSNGSLMDLGVYGIYPLVVLFGKPQEVKAVGTLLESGVDGEGTVLMKYDEMDAVVMYSKITNSELPSEIQGEDGSIVIDKLSTPEQVEIRYRDGNTETISQVPDKPFMYYELEAFIRLIQEGKAESDINSFTNSRVTAEIMETARRQIGVVYPADER